MSCPRSVQGLVLSQSLKANPLVQPGAWLGAWVLASRSLRKSLGCVTLGSWRALSVLPFYHL